MVYNESLMFLGNEEQSRQLLAVFEEYGRRQRGFVVAVLCKALPNYVHDVYEAKNREQPLGLTLLQQGLSHGVLITDYNFDDETQFHFDEAKALGLKQLVQGGKRCFIQIAEGHWYTVTDDCFALANIPFRLAAWQPLQAVHGATSAINPDDAYNPAIVQAANWQQQEAYQRVRDQQLGDQGKTRNFTDKPYQKRYT